MTQKAEQLAVVVQAMEDNKTEHKEIKDALVRIDCKLDSVIKEKADKEAVISLDNRFWGIIVGMLFLLAGIIAAWFKK